MDYAKKAAEKPKKREEPSQHKQSDNRSQEQAALLKFIDNLRKNQRPSRPPDKNAPPVWTSSRSQLQRKFPPITRIGGLSNKLSNLKIEEEETTEEKKERLKLTLSKFDSPFIWKPMYKKLVGQKESVISKLQEKDGEIVDEKKFKWRNFILHLVISYELNLAGRVPEAIEAVSELEKTLVENTESCEWLFMGIQHALWHVVTTSKAFLYLEQNRLEEVDQMIDRVQPVHTMRRAARAGIHGIRAAVFMEYGHEGNVMALAQAKKAVELDATSPEWHFLLSKCMGRIRRVANCHEPVDLLECTSLNKAVSLDKRNPLYKVYLAQTIRERAFRWYKETYPENRSEEAMKLEKALRAAYHKYLEARDLRPDCPHILTRCAYGVMKLPFQYVNLKFVRECLDKAIKLAPNNMMTHHIKGLYHERFDVDAELALKEIRLAADLGNFGASMDLVRMRYRLKKGDTIEELEEVAERYAEPNYIQIAYTQAGSYLLFIKFNLVEAIKFFTKVIDIDLDSYAMRSHKSIFLRMKDPVNMFEVLLEELDKNTEWESFSLEDAKILKRFRIRILKHDSLESEKARPTVANILELSRTQIGKDLKKHGKTLNIKGRKLWHGMRWETRKGTKRKKKKKACDKKTDEKKSKVEQGGCSTSRRREEFRSSKPAERSCSVTSVSSVDSNYQRNSFTHGPRGFFFTEDSDSNEPSSIPRYPSTDEVTESGMSGRFSEHLSRLRSHRSRESSICSVSSDEQVGGKPSDFQSQRAVHSSRYSSHINFSNQEEKSVTEINLTVENLKLFDSAGSDSFRPRRPSVSSMGSETGNERLSVMDRVKQSYAMLNRDDKGGNQSQKKNHHRSESSQSLQKQKYKKKSNLPRTDSTQSLNVEVDSLRTRIEHLRPFGSRGSSVESRRTFSFMPSFSRTDKEQESDKQ